MPLGDIPLRAGDRVLVLGIPSPEDVARLAARLPQGLLVAMGDEPAVRAARRAASHLDNVMFVQGTAAEIPWRDGMFTVIALAGEPTPEVRRVLAPEGALHSL